MHIEHTNVMCIQGCPSWDANPFKVILSIKLYGKGVSISTQGV